MRKELFINKNPLLSGYCFYGGLFSILPGNENIMPWVYSNFIQLKYLLSNNLVFFDRYRSLLDGCPFINHYILTRSELKEEGEQSLVEIIKDKIDNEAYCFIYIDRFYIPFHKEWYHKGHLTHEMLIYGYDDEKREFICSDNGDNGMYGHYTCTFTELLDGYWKNTEDDSYYFSMHYIQDVIIPDEPYMFNYKQAKRSFIKYYYSKSMLNESEECIPSIFGFKIHNLVLKNQQDVIKKYGDKFYFNLRQIYIIVDHKELMKKRMTYLMENGYLPNEDFDKKYDYLLTKYKLLLSKCIKYNITKDKSIFDKHFVLFQELINYERNILEDIINKLK